MSGESNNIKFSVEPQQLDLGLQLYNRVAERDLIIFNSGKVPYDFCINTSLLSRQSVVEPVPRSGLVGPGHKETIKLKVGEHRGREGKSKMTVRREDEVGLRACRADAIGISLCHWT